MKKIIEFNGYETVEWDHQGNIFRLKKCYCRWHPNIIILLYIGRLKTNNNFYHYFIGNMLSSFLMKNWKNISGASRANEAACATKDGEKAKCDEAKGWGQTSKNGGKENSPSCENSERGGADSPHRPSTDVMS